MKFQKIEVTQSDFSLKGASPGLAISIDGIAKGMLYNFQHPTSDSVEAIYIIDLLLDYLNSDGSAERIEIGELSIQYVGPKRITYFFDTQYQSNMAKEVEYIKELKEKIYIKKFDLFAINGNEITSLYYASSYCEEVHISLLNVQSLTLRAPKITSINLSGSTIKSLDINEITEDSELNILGGSIQSLSISNMYSIRENTGYIKSLLIFSDIEYLKIEGFLNPLKIHYFQMYNLKIGKGFLKKIIMESLEWNNIEIDNTYFGDITFPKISSDFRIRSTRFLNSTFSDINWGNYFAENYKSFDGKINFKITDSELKESYRMLKHIHDSIGNKTEANKFFAKEMEYHMKALKKSGDRKNYLIAWLQKEISDFGNDWVRALSWYFIFTLLCYAIYSGFDFISHEWINIWSNERFIAELSRLTKVLNPLPKVEDISNPLLLLFSLIKILIVYQIVVALRRISQR